jgi:serine/threonine protein kinase
LSVGLLVGWHDPTTRPPDHPTTDVVYGVPPPILDRYEILRPLGQGGFGSTWLGRDLQVDRRSCSRSSGPAATPTLKAYELFQREARY